LGDGPPAHAVRNLDQPELLEHFQQMQSAGRHSRESGNLFLNAEQALRWMPAFARMTLRCGFQPSRNFFTRSKT
jgi:hypothetical protein